MMMIDKIAYASPWRKKSPYIKSAVAVGTLLICVCARSFVVSCLVLMIMGWLTVMRSRTSLSHYMKLMAAPLVFLALGTVVIAVNFTSQPMDLFNIAVGSGYIAVSRYSLMYSIRLILVSLASVSCLYFLNLTTPMLDLIAVLRSLKCPWLIVELMTMIYRYIFVLLDMAVAISQAQDCRLGNRDAKTAIYSMGTMLSVVLMKALSRASQLFDAMESRCYDGKLELLQESWESRPGERFATAAYLVALSAVAVVCKINGGI